MIYLFKEVWQYTGKDKWKFVLFFGLHFISLSGALMKPYAFGRFIDALTLYGTQNYDPAIRWIGFYVLGFFVFELFHRIGQYFVITVGLRNQQRFRNQMFKLVYKLPMKWHVAHHSGDVVSRINMAAEAVSEFTFESIKYLEVFMYALGPIIILTTISWQIALICVVVTVVNNIVVTWLNGKIEAIMDDKHESRHKLNSKMMDLVGNIKTIITLKTGEGNRREIDAQYKAYYKHSMREHNVNQPRCFIMSFSLILAEMLIIWYYLGSQRGQEVLMIGTLVMVVNYYRQMSDMIFTFMGSIYDTIDWKASIGSVSMITGGAIEYGLDLSSDGDEDSQVVQRLEQNLIIKDLNFSYGLNGPGLKGVEVEIVKGRRTAIVGLSGCGKSTLLSLMAGLYEPDSVRIINEDGQDLRMSDLHPHCLLAGQTSEVFDHSLRYNLTMGIEVSEGELDRLVGLAQLTDVVDRLPMGYESQLRERGVNLSGGEMQRIALARSLHFATDKDILLLDEITSSVDAFNEGKIYENIFEAYGGRTIFCTIHRLHLLEMFDDVLVMVGGEIVQRGSFDDLKGQDGPFGQLWERYLLSEQ